MIREIKFYSTESGRIPVEEFIDALESDIARKITYVLRLIEDLQIVPAKFFQKMSGTNGLWEIRVEYESNTYRILGFFDKEIFFVAAHAFKKKAQKTPFKEIKTAEERKNDYFRRKENERSGKIY